MAELATASGIAGLISLTIEIFGISYKYIQGVRGASSSVHRFLKELEDLQTVLRRVEQFSKDIDEADVFGDTGSCLLSIEKSNEYMDLLLKVRNKLQQRQTGSSIRDGVKSLTWPFSEKETSALTDSLHRHLEIYNTALAVDNLTVGKLTLNEVRQSNASQAGSRIQEILNWLSPLNMYQKQQDTLSRRHGTTGSWLLNNSVFRSWVDSDDSQRTLWCPGDPGTGKTVITSVVIDYLINNNAGKDTKIAYLYCDYKNQAMQTAPNLLACLARQIIGFPKALPPQLEEMHRELEYQRGRPSFEELKKLLIALFNQYERTYVIVDALDECEAIRERRLLMPVLELLPRTSGRLLVTSRPNNEDISNTFGKASQITITASESDLRQYVTERIAEEECKTSVTRFKPELKENIIATVSTGASGMFLLAALQMDRVFSTRTVKGIKFALASMPQKIDELYKLTLERIQRQAGDDGTLAMRILSWITHARRPLSVNELRHGLAVEYNNDEDIDLNATELDEDNLLQPESLVDVCAGLVIIDSASQIIRLVHYTTQEYFGNKLLDLFAGAEADISKACLTCLSYDIGHRFPDRYIAMSAFESNPFLHYASRHWFSHVHSILSVANPAPEFLKLVARFKCSDSSLRSIDLLRCNVGVELGWIFYARPDKECLGQETALENASFWGLEELVTVLLDHSTGPYPGIDRSLFYASYCGRIKVVELMLRYGPQVDVPVDVIFECQANTALGAACKNGHLPVAKILVGYGANPYVGEKPPMHVAALLNKSLIVDFLLKEGVNVNARDSGKQTALHNAVSYSRVDVVKLLLENHCDLDLKDDRGMTALHHAAGKVPEYGVDMVKCLLDAHCDPELKDNKGMTALHHAAGKVPKYGVDVVKYLLDAHCDPELKDNEGMTALHHAAGKVPKYGVDVVKFLLDAHCDLNLKAENGRTALHFAAYSFALDILELLLDRGADASAKDKSGRIARNVLESKLSLKDYDPCWLVYLSGKREKAGGLVQRMTLLEQTSPAPPVNDS